MRLLDPITRRSRPATGAVSPASNRWAAASIACGVTPILLLFLYQPFIAGALRHLFPTTYLGAYIEFLAVPLLLTVCAVGSGLMAMRRSARPPAKYAHFSLAMLAFALSLLDVGLFLVVWLPTVKEAHS